ncbi:MAG: hypothetical protein V3R52_05660, partial [Candidatus Neomarinimicrobiota bacterium]
MKNPVKNKYPKISARLQSPFRMINIIVLSVFSLELIVMTLVHKLEFSSLLLETVLDSTLLVILLSPIFYIFIFRPLVIFIAEREQAEDELRRSEEFNR